MQIYTPSQMVDFTDTGLWRLIVYISRGGMSAYLKHLEDDTIPTVMLFTKEWDDDDTPLLRKIENCVYDNPRLLEDYATDIILETQRLVWAPEDFLDSEDAETEIYAEIYPSDNLEVLSDRHGEMTALYSLTPGVAAFLSRTIPGARVRSHIGVIVGKYLPKSTSAATVYVDIRKGECDIVATKDEQLLATATHPWSALEDIAYRIIHLAMAYNVKPKDLQVSLSGFKEERETLAEILRRHCGYVIQTSGSEDTDAGIPLALAILLGLTN